MRQSYVLFDRSTTRLTNKRKKYFFQKMILKLENSRPYLFFGELFDVIFIKRLTSRSSEVKSLIFEVTEVKFRQPLKVFEFKVKLILST